MADKKVNFLLDEQQEQFTIYCKKGTEEKLFKKLVDGVDVKHYQVAKNGLIEITIISKKKRGRPQYKNIDIGLLLKMHDAGVPVIKLAEYFSCSQQYIYHLLKNNNELRRE